MKYQVKVNVYVTRGRSVKLIKNMSLVSNGVVKMGTVVRLLHLPPWALDRLRGEEDLDPFEVEQDVQDRKEMNLFVEGEER